MDNTWTPKSAFRCTLGVLRFEMYQQGNCTRSFQVHSTTFGAVALELNVLIQCLEVKTYQPGKQYTKWRHV
jgi:hypothetical protein